MGEKRFNSFEPVAATVAARCRSARSFEEAKNYDLIDGILEEIEMVDKILRGEDLATVHYTK